MIHCRSWLLSALLCLAAVLGAQEGVEFKVMMPDKYERATEVDAQGLTQWAEHKTPCPTCACTLET